MKYTLLDIVSDILSDMDGDYVSSINDTDEALQVAQIVKTTYQAMMSNRNWPHTARAITLQPLSDVSQPTHMRIAEDIKEIISIYYDVRLGIDNRVDYNQMKYVDPDVFLRFINNRNSNDPFTRTVVDPSGIKLLISTNKAPQYYTSFDDTTIVFDSFDAGLDDTLISAKVQARAYIIPVFEMQDDFIPDLPDEAFAALIEEAKSKAMFKLKQVQDIKAEQEATRQQRWLSRKSWRAHAPDIYPFNYGRNRGGLKRDPTFRRP